MSKLSRAWLRPRGFWLDVLPALLYVGVVFWVGLIPLKSLPGPDFWLVDKVWHLVGTCGLAALVARALGYLGRRPALAARDAGLLAAALGGLLEVLQSFTRYRSADWADFLADSLGAALACAVLLWLQADGSRRKGSA